MLHVISFKISGTYFAFCEMNLLLKKYLNVVLNNLFVCAELRLTLYNITAEHRHYMHKYIKILQLFSYSIYTLVSVASVIVAELFCLYRMIF